MRLVTFTNLYPSRDMPRHGIFVEERLRHLVASGDINASVLALRPTRPRMRLAQHKSNGKVTEVRSGIPIDYRSVPTLPKISNWIDPWTWASATESALREVVQQSAEPVILDAHFLYPDGVAAVILARRLGLPVVLSARGSDVNVKCLNPVFRRSVQWAAVRSDAIVAVSQALATRIAELDIHPPILQVIPNGVDLRKFRPADKEQSRRRFGVTGKVIASIGHLVADKGHQFAVEAIAQLPDATLLIVGDGPMKPFLLKQARRFRVSERVQFLGLLPHDQMRYLYSAADVLVLASAREGMPNVVLESLACGTRVVATAVGGIGEIIRSEVSGVLMSDRSTKELLGGLAKLETLPVDPQATREYAVQFGWDKVIGAQIALYRSIMTNFVH
jgi:teichuronic acid biosynthesis glycosyltransferase TuaC